MTEQESKKTDELLEKIKEKGNGFDRDALMVVGTIAFSTQAKEHGGTLKILDEMIKLLDKYPNADDFVAEAGLLIGIK